MSVPPLPLALVATELPKAEMCVRRLTPAILSLLSLLCGPIHHIVPNASTCLSPSARASLHIVINDEGMVSDLNIVQFASKFGVFDFTSFATEHPALFNGESDILARTIKGCLSVAYSRIGMFLALLSLVIQPTGIIADRVRASPIVKSNLFPIPIGTDSRQVACGSKIPNSKGTLRARPITPVKLARLQRRLAPRTVGSNARALVLQTKSYLEPGP
ncbi:hypothetical protein BD779DRAFT_1676278 [Infundibulicybe gibba]|nr:hypothetical protein BD779DRAFT_1676278 [Infundibulicybe gibba]